MQRASAVSATVINETINETPSDETSAETPAVLVQTPVEQATAAAVEIPIESPDLSHNTGASFTFAVQLEQRPSREFALACRCVDGSVSHYARFILSVRAQLREHYRAVELDP